MTEEEQLNQALAELEAEYGVGNVSIMGRHPIKELTLIWEEKEYEPEEEVNNE